MKIILTDREAEFMQVLWERGPSTVAEVLEALEDDPAYTTVLNILRNLESKGYVRPVKEGRAHRYEPRITREAARTSALRRLLGSFYAGSQQLLLTQLISDKKLAESDIEHIRQLLDQHEQNRRAKR
jgi:BlaI family transcriptional regulator, penicillinase repressor